MRLKQQVQESRQAIEAHINEVLSRIHSEPKLSNSSKGGSP